MFRIYDDDDNGLITSGNLLRCAGDLGEDVTHEEVDMMISMADKDHKGGVDQEDFISLMKELEPLEYICKSLLAPNCALTLSPSDRLPVSVPPAKSNTLSPGLRAHFAKASLFHNR